MPTNSLFNSYQNSLEQSMLHQLVYESITIYGQDMYYLPRRIMERGMFGGDVDMSKYDTAYPIEVFIGSVEGFNSETNILSMQGLEIRDRVTFTIADLAFQREVTATETTLARPLEGDLLFFPLNGKCFQIKFVDNKPFFYQLGTLPMYDLQCELFEYSGQIMETGIAAIDSMQERYTPDVYYFAIKTENGFHLMTENGELITHDSPDHDEFMESFDDSDDIQTQANAVLVFSEDDPFTENGTY